MIGTDSRSTAALSVALQLPLSSSLTDLLLRAPSGSVGSDVALSIAAELKSELAGTGKVSQPYPPIRIDGYRLQGSRWGSGVAIRDVPFQPSLVTSRRSIGLIALDRCIAGDCHSPIQAVGEVLDLAANGARDTGTGRWRRNVWWVEWFRSLDSAGRAVVKAEVANWVTQIWTAVDWSRLGSPPVIGERDAIWNCPTRRGLSLSGRADVKMSSYGGEVVLNAWSGWAPGRWRVVLGLTALVALLDPARRPAVTRVVGLWPQSGQFRIAEVDGTLLRDTIDAVVAAATVGQGQPTTGRALP